MPSVVEDRRTGKAAGRDRPASRPVRAGDEDLEDGGEYRMLPETEGDSREQKGPRQESVASTWVPIRGAEQPTRGGGRREPMESLRSHARSNRARRHVEMPGPFFRWSALVYPWLHSNWLRWLGLSFMTVLAVGVVATTIFVSWVLVQVGAFVSVLAVSSMAMVCLALVSYVVASFVTVIEDTASGDDHLERLVDFSWWDILPRFMRAVGAAGVGGVAIYGITYPLRRWFAGDAPELILVQCILMYQLYPVLLFTNLADDTWVPIWSLATTVRRLASCVGYYVAFLAITAPFAVMATAGLAAVYKYGIAIGIAGTGPIAAAWLMYYGHWLGRLARQLAEPR